MLTLDPILFLIALVLLPVIDSPWLYLQSTSLGGIRMFEKIQGSPVSMRLLPAAVVYIALAFLLLQQTDVLQAAFSGAATYAVYDFTNLAVFKDYTLQFAVMDSLWGGILFAAAFLALNKIRTLL